MLTTAKIPHSDASTRQGERPNLSQCRHIVSLPTYGRIRGWGTVHCSDLWPPGAAGCTRADRQEARGGCQGPHGYSQLSCRALWQCLPCHGFTWLQLLSTIRALFGGCIDRSPGALTLHVSIGVSICRHMRAAFGLWLAQRSTWWLFPEAPPDL